MKTSAPFGIAGHLDKYYRRKCGNFPNHHDLQYPSILIIAMIIPYLQYDARKYILSICRIQQNIYKNKELLKLRRDVNNDILPLPDTLRNHLVKMTAIDKNQGLTTYKLLDLVNNFYDNPLCLTLLSYLTRAEVTVYPDQLIELKEQGINKELAASQQPNREQELYYGSLFANDTEGLHRDLGEVDGSKVVNLWCRHLRGAIRHFGSQRFILFPH